MAKSNTTTALARRSSTRSRRQVQSIYDDAAREVMGAADDARANATSGSRKKKRAKKVSVLILPIYNLPDSVLLHIAGFVENSSRVLLAVALTASSTHWRKSNWDIKPPAAARTILTEKPLKNFGQYWRVDFAEIDNKELATKLSDEDVGGALACIGDIHTIKSVTITNCVNISGHGLGPLRGFTSLKSLDLSLAGYRGKINLDPEPKLSKTDVIPILDSILDSEDCGLYSIKFPKKWRVERSLLLVRFLAKYNRLMNTRGITCSGYTMKEDGSYVLCEDICQGTTERPWISKSGDTFGICKFMCHKCGCSYCSDECAGDNIPEALCQRCETKYCNDCSETLTCDVCHETTCHGCSMIGECEVCEETTCGPCCPVFRCDCCGSAQCMDCVPYEFCSHAECSENNCAECADENHNCVKYCVACEVVFCGEHLLKEVVRHTDYYCSDCKSRAALILSESNRCFGEWVLKLEGKYSAKGHDCWTSAGEDFSQAMEAREELRQRCHAVGNNLLLKQKRFERFDILFRQFESCCLFNP